VVPKHKDIKIGTLAGILKQAEITVLLLIIALRYRTRVFESPEFIYACVRDRSGKPGA
jgi:hypothetical protein